MPTKRPLTRLRDIVENGCAVIDYTRGMDFESFTGNRLVRDGSERCLLRVSEAATKLGATAEDILPQHDWRKIRSFGNFLRHEYEDIQDKVVWTIVTQHLPLLLADLKAFLARYPEDQETL